MNRTHLQVISLCTYNVHNFTNAQHKINHNEISDVLGNFTIAGLQEIDSDINKVCENADMRVVQPLFENALVYSKGTVIYSKYHRFQSTRNVATGRSVTSVIIQFNTGVVMHIYVTHLDHRDEKMRILQFDELLGIIEKEKQEIYNGKIFPHIILGDFNALTRSDYSQERWEEIRNVRLNGNWELPQTELTDKIKNLGYYDIIDLYSRYHCKKLPMTSRFGTRVDYIYSNFKYNVTEAGALDTDASDHLPIYVKIEL